MLLTDELLLNYKRCQRRTFLDVCGDPSDREQDKDFLLKLRRENRTHIDRVLAKLKRNYHQVITFERDWQTKAEETEHLMQQGVDCIYEGVLAFEVSRQNLVSDKELAFDKITTIGNPHLLLKKPGNSKYGDWSYVPISVKLGRRPKPEYKLIAAFHAQLLACIQETSPATSQIILRDYQTYTVNLNQWIPKTKEIIVDCLQVLHQSEEPEVFISRQRCNLCHWYDYCYQNAKVKQHLSLVPGITPNRYEYLQTKGIITLESLAAASADDLGEIFGFEIASGLTQQAQSLLQDRAMLKWNYDSNVKSIIPDTNIELYFDIEAEPERNLDYLLGVLVVDRLNDRETFHAFLAEKPEDEGKVWQDFLNLVTHYDRAPIFHYSEYEVETMQRLAWLYDTPSDQLETILSRCVDVHWLVTNSVTLPVESYSLKALANWLGFSWRDRGVSGEQSVCWYDRWLETGDRDLLEAILRYNEDDCRATLHLKEWFVKFLSSNC
jgi:uncharacterized protein